MRLPPPQIAHREFGIAHPFTALARGNLVDAFDELQQPDEARTLLNSHIDLLTAEMEKAKNGEDQGRQPTRRFSQLIEAEVVMNLSRSSLPRACRNISRNQQFERHFLIAAGPRAAESICDPSIAIAGVKGS